MPFCCGQVGLTSNVGRIHAGGIRDPTQSLPTPAARRTARSSTASRGFFFCSAICARIDGSHTDCICVSCGRCLFTSSRQLRHACHRRSWQSASAASATASGFPGASFNPASACLCASAMLPKAASRSADSPARLLRHPCRRPGPRLDCPLSSDRRPRELLRRRQRCSTPTPVRSFRIQDAARTIESGSAIAGLSGPSGARNAMA